MANQGGVILLVCDVCVVLQTLNVQSRCDQHPVQTIQCRSEQVLKLFILDRTSFFSFNIFKLANSSILIHLHAYRGQ